MASLPSPRGIVGLGSVARASTAQRLERSAGESEDNQTRVFLGFPF